MNIYDCFMYYDEDLLLDLRLNILDKYVKQFVITEATYSHNGDKKKLNFNINNFSKFKDKINYIIVDQPPPSLLTLDNSDNQNQKGDKLILNGYARDNYQREQLMNGLKNLQDNDLILISDLDEIPNLSKVNFDLIKNKIIIFKQDMFYYKFNLQYDNFIWFGTKACRKKNFKSPQWLRNIKSKKYSKFRLDNFFSNTKYSDIAFINEGGWHFTCIRSAIDLQKKLLNFAHHYEFENSGIKLNDLDEMIKEQRVMYSHASDQTNQSKWGKSAKLKKIGINNLPEFIKLNFDKYNKWID